MGGEKHRRFCSDRRFSCPYRNRSAKMEAPFSSRTSCRNETHIWSSGVPPRETALSISLCALYHVPCVLAIWTGVNRFSLRLKNCVAINKEMRPASKIQNTNLNFLLTRKKPLDIESARW